MPKRARSCCRGSVLRIPFLAFTMLVAASASLSAQTLFTASLDGAQEVPPVTTDASGTASLVLDLAPGSLAYSVTLSGVDLDGNQTPGDATDNVTAMHFHRGAAGVIGPVVFGLIAPGHDPDDLVIDPVAGTMTGAWEETDTNGNAALSAELANLLGGDLYLNVHTVAEGSGEIRGQVLQITLANGLQLHVEFEDDVLDSSPNGFDGQASGDLQFTAGMIGQAADFDGVDDQVLFPTFPDSLIADNDLTIAFWFNLEAGSQFSVLSKREVCMLNPFFDIRTSNLPQLGVSFEIADATDNHGVAVLSPTPGWHHVAFTRSRVDLQAFLDGELVDEDTTPSLLDLTNSAVLGLSNSPCIGQDGTAMLEGGIDDLRIWNRLLTSTEVANVGGIFADGFESGDVSAWTATAP